MVEHQLRPPPPRGAARPQPGRASWPTGRSTATSWCGWAPACTYARVDHRARRARCPAWRWPRAPSARRRSATAAPSAATSARPPPPATRHPPLLAAGRRVEVASVRGSRLIGSTSSILGPEAHRRSSPDELIRAVPDAGRRRPEPVRQGRHPQRDGDRGLLVRARPAPGGAPGRRTGIGSAAPTPRSAPGRRGVPRRRAGLGTAGRPGRTAPRWPAGSASWWRGRLADRRRPRHRRATAGTRSACWPAAP